jgi:hypothetical protein
MFAGVCLLMGLAVVGIIITYFHIEHGPDSEKG